MVISFPFSLLILPKSQDEINWKSLFFVLSSFLLPNFSFVVGKVDEKATQLHAIASLKVLLDATKPNRGNNNDNLFGRIFLFFFFAFLRV